MKSFPNLPPGCTDRDIEIAAGAFDEDDPQIEHGRWWGPEFCMIPADQQPIMDGCYFCGGPVHGLNGEHNHTMSEKEGFKGATRTRYSCVCESC